MNFVPCDSRASPFCMKVQAILDYKGIEYERINILGPADFALLGQLHYVRRTPIGRGEIARRPEIVAFLDADAIGHEAVLVTVGDRVLRITFGDPTRYLSLATGLEMPWGMARHPVDPNEVLVAARDSTVLPDAGRVLALRLDTHQGKCY